MTNDAFGVVTEAGTVRFERRLRGPIERVWTHLTQSEERGRWLATGTMEPRIGGKVELHFRNDELSGRREAPPAKYAGQDNGCFSGGRITAYDPCRKLAFTWGEGSGEASEVTFELSAEGDHVDLVLTHRRLSDPAAMLSVAAGWHAHLGILVDRLDDRSPQPFWATHAALEEAYAPRLAGGPGVYAAASFRSGAHPQP